MASARSPAEQWAESTLAEQGIAVTGSLEPVRAMPWSQVGRYPTQQGFIYFKQMAPLFAREPIVLAFLNAQDATVPRLIAHNSALHCFMMHDAGQPLRPLLKERYDAAIVCRALEVCAEIQQQAVPHVQTLLASGVADWRLMRLPDLLTHVLADVALMQAESLELTERAALRAALPKLAALCTDLTDCGIPETLEHGDFHDNNFMRQANGALIINDWGDASISHPFFSLASCLESAGRNHNILPGDAIYERLKTAYLQSWHKLARAETCERAFQLALQIRPVQFAVNYSRLAYNVRCEPANYHAGWIANVLRQFLTAIN